MKALLALLLSAWSALASCVPPPNTYDWEAELWRSTALSTNNGNVSATAYRAGTVFMQHAKWWGLRPLLGRVNLYVGTDTNGMKVPIVRDWVNSAVFAPDELIAFTSADFSESTGLTGDGLTKYLIPNGSSLPLMLSSVTVQTNIHLAVYMRTTADENAFAMGAQDNFSTPLASLAVDRGSGVSHISGVFVGDTSAANLSGDTNGIGFYMGTRRSTTDITLYKNGVGVATNTTADTGALATVRFVVHALGNQTGTPVLFNSRTFSYYGVGYAIPDALAKPYNDLVQDAQTTMARHVGP